MAQPGGTRRKAQALSTQDIIIKKVPVRVTDGVLHLYRFEEHDAGVVAFVDAAEDPETAVHQIMQIGARSLAFTATSVDTAVVANAFDGMARQFDGTLEETVKHIGGITEALLDDDAGALPKAMKAFTTELDRLLGDAFDPDSKKSIVGMFERLWSDASRAQVEAVRRVVDPDNESSPLGRHRAEIIKTVKETEEKLSKALAEVSEKIAVSKAQAELMEKTSTKGFEFEDLVHLTVSGVAAAHCDIAEQTGRSVGATGSQAGDEVVTLCLDDTRGATARFVLELKDRKLGMKATFEELDRAMDNREALVGIAVFSRQEHAPVAGPFHFWGNYAVVVLDKDVVDDGALRLACLWARWMVRRQLGDTAMEVNAERVAGLVEDGRRALDHVSTVRRYHTSARKCIDQAGGQVTAMASEFEIVLDAIAEEVSG